MTDTIDIYVGRTLASLDRAVAEAALPDVRVTDRRAAEKVAEKLLETLAGLAVGSCVGTVLFGVRTTFGIDAVTKIPLIPRPRARAVLEADGPARRPTAELKLRLRGRIGRCRRDASAMIANIENEIPREDRAAFARMLGLMASDELTAEKYARAVRAGWRCAAAIIEGRSVPAVEELWQRWATKVAGVTEQRDEVFLQIA